MPENAPNIFSTWVWEEARQERIRAHRKHGDTSMESQAPDAWRRYMILAEEVGEVAKEYNDADHEGRPVDLAKLRKELIQVAAMAGAWAAAIHTDAFDAYEYHHEVEDAVQIPPLHSTTWIWLAVLLVLYVPYLISTYRHTRHTKKGPQK